MQGVELCSQSGGEIAFGNLQSLVCRLHIFCFRLENAVSLFEIEKCTAHFRGNGAPSRCQRLHGCFAPGARCLHPPSGGKPIEDIPRRVYPHHIPIIKFLTDFRIAFAVNLIPGKSPDMRARSAPVQDILLVFDLDILLPGFDYRPIRIGPRQAVVQVGMVRLIL